MIYERLVEAYDNAGAGDQWRCFAQAVIAAVRAAEVGSVHEEGPPAIVPSGAEGSSSGDASARSTG